MGPSFRATSRSRDKEPTDGAWARMPPPGAARQTRVRGVLRRNKRPGDQRLNVQSDVLVLELGEDLDLAPQRFNVATERGNEMVAAALGARELGL